MAASNFEIINARFTYKNIPLHKLGKYRFADIKTAYDAFRAVNGLDEVVIIQTASRVEVFMAVAIESDAPDARSQAGKGLVLSQIERTWAGLSTLEQWDLDHFDQTLEVYRGTKLYAHLLRLATGLESVVVGKSEILDEIKSAALQAKESGASGAVLGALFDTAVRIGSKIRDSTGIGKGVITIGDVAVKMAKDGAGIDAKKKILLVGTGTIAALAAKSLNKKGYPFEVTSRTLERAAGFADVLGGTPISFDDALAGFDRFDAVLVATTADYHIITASSVRRVMEGKKTGAMILDISEPRAINEDVSSVPGIKLMFRDQIAEQEEESLNARRAKIPQVEKAIEKEVPVIEAMMGKLELAPKEPDVASGLEALKKEELERAIKQLGDADENTIKVMENLARSVAERITSGPSKRTAS